MSLSKHPGLRLVSKMLARDLRRRATPAEKLFWEAVRGRRFFGRKFYRQYPILVDNDGRETFYIADFFCFEAKLVIEIDGQVHDFTKRNDEYRTDILRQHGIKVVRFTNLEVESGLQDVLGQLKTILALT